MLSIRGLAGGYGSTKVLFDVNLEVDSGEIVGLLGRNGMGKTTAIKTIFGLLPSSSGSMDFDGRSIVKQRSFRIARAGLSLVPEGRQIFPLLTVEQNLLATARTGPSGSDRWTVDAVFDFFPSLAERRKNFGNQLSGGEQQMLAIGRALVMNPELLVLDEATEGLAPAIRHAIWDGLRVLKNEGQSILIVDAHLKELLKLTERNVILEKGTTVWSGTSAELAANDQIKHTYLGVG